MARLGTCYSSTASRERSRASKSDHGDAYRFRAREVPKLKRSGSLLTLCATLTTSLSAASTQTVHATPAFFPQRAGDRWNLVTTVTT
jgi:hypothetical protein